MKNKESKKRYRRYNKALLDKIDSMPMENENSAYKAIKKQTVGETELFGDQIYHGADDENSVEYKENPKITFVIVITIMLACVVGIAFLILKMI